MDGRDFLGRGNDAIEARVTRELCEREYVIDALVTVEQVPRDAIDEAVPFDWSDHATFVAALERVDIAGIGGASLPSTELTGTLDVATRADAPRVVELTLDLKSPRLATTTLASLQASLDEAAERRHGPWLWVYHGPPEGPLAWTGSRFFGDPELPALMERHRPDVVLCGHIHQAPFVAGGAWHDRIGSTMLFNSGYQRGNIPAHVFLELDTEAHASWWSMAGEGEVAFAGSTAATPQ